MKYKRDVFMVVEIKLRYNLWRWFAEALRIRHHIPELDIKIICLTSFVNDRELDEIITSEINKTNHLIVIDTANYNYGLLQGVLGQLARKLIYQLK